MGTSAEAIIAHSWMHLSTKALLAPFMSGTLCKDTKKHIYKERENRFFLLSSLLLFLKGPITGSPFLYFSANILFFDNWRLQNHTFLYLFWALGLKKEGGACI